MEKTMENKNLTPHADYGMHTQVGNLTVQHIVHMAINSNNDTKNAILTALAQLTHLHRVSYFSEALDAIVRESVVAEITRCMNSHQNKWVFENYQDSMVWDCVNDPNSNLQVKITQTKNNGFNPHMNRISEAAKNNQVRITVEILQPNSDTDT